MDDCGPKCHHCSPEEGYTAVTRAMKGDHIVIQVSIGGETATIIIGPDKIPGILEDTGALGSMVRMLTMTQ